MLEAQVEKSAVVQIMRNNPLYKRVVMGDFPGVMEYLNEQKHPEIVLTDEIFWLAKEQQNKQVISLISLLKGEEIKEAFQDHLFLLLSCIVNNYSHLLRRLLKKFHRDALEEEDEAELYYAAIRCGCDESVIDILSPEESVSFITEEMSDIEVADITTMSLITDIQQQAYSRLSLKIKKLIEAEDKGIFYATLAIFLQLSHVPDNDNILSLLLYCNRNDLQTLLYYLENDHIDQLDNLYLFSHYIAPQTPHFTLLDQWISHQYLEGRMFDVARFKKIYYVLDCTQEEIAATMIDPPKFSNKLTVNEYQTLSICCEKLGDRELIMERLNIPNEQPMEIKSKTYQKRQAELEEIAALQSALISFKKWYKFRGHSPLSAALYGKSTVNLVITLLAEVIAAEGFFYLYSRFSCDRDIASKEGKCIVAFSGLVCAAIALLVTAGVVLFGKIYNLTLREMRDPLTENLPDTLASRVVRVAIARDVPELTQNMRISALLQILQEEAGRIRRWINRYEIAPDATVEINVQDQGVGVGFNTLNAVEEDLQKPLLIGGF